MGPTIEEQRKRIRKSKMNEFPSTTCKPTRGIFNLSKLNDIIDIAEHNRVNLVSHATKEERMLIEYLDSWNAEYQFQYPLYVKNKLYIVDFYLPKIKVAIEVDGFHHYTKEGKEKDRIRDNNLRSEGINTLRITNLKFRKFETVHKWCAENGIIKR